MRKMFLTFVLLFAIANIEALPKIPYTNGGHCDKSSQGVLRITVVSEEPITTALEFNLNLIGPETITAQCLLEGQSTNKPIISPSDKTIETGIPGTSSDKGEGIFDSNLEKTDKASSDKGDEVFDSTLEDQNSDDEEDFDSTQAPENAADPADGNGRLRRLENSYSNQYEIYCSYQPPKVQGNFKVEADEDQGVTVDEWVWVYLFPCLSVSAASSRASISISFRQVSKFDFKTFSFKFFALTRYIITDINYTIKFLVFLLKGNTKAPEPVEISCPIDQDSMPKDSGAALYPVSFNCGMGDGFEVGEYTSLEIASSDDIAGLPNDETLLNPNKTDEAIANGELADLSEAPVPTYFEITEAPEIDTTQGTFNMQIPISEGIQLDFSKFKTFRFPLAFPSGVWIIGHILGIENWVLNIDFLINGKIENQPLIWEQNVISINGQELFVLPGYKTEAITTEGYQGELPEKEVDEPSSDQEQAGDSDEVATGSDQAGNSDEVATGSDQAGDSNEVATGSDQVATGSDQAGKSNEVATGSDQAGKSDEVATGSDQAGDSDEVSSDGSEEGSDESASSDNGSSSSSESGNEEPISLEDALARAAISISFRQLNGFKFENGIISFFFYALTTQSIEAGHYVVLLVNLIGANGMEEELTEITCTITEAVTLPSGQSMIQANYECKLEGLDQSKGYTSLRLSSSADIVGIPDDETLLNPVLTQQAIENGELKDCSSDPSVPPTFKVDSLDNCDDTGNFLIKGALSETKSIAAKFTMPLTFPEGTSLTCTYETDGIKCLADKELSGTVVMEQKIIANGPEELFLLTSFNKDDMSCANGLELKAEEKLNVEVSFRQVSHIEIISQKVYFFFAAFVNKKLEASHSIQMNVLLNIGSEKKEKSATCVLNEGVEGSGAQGDFNCTLDLESDENISTEDLSISTNNDNIGGCAELTTEEASPKETDDAIEDAANATSELATTLDYSLEENKNKKPPSLKLKKFDLKRCISKGKIKVAGTLSEAITEEMTFELPFSFPASQVKCTIEPTTDIENVEIDCKIQKTKKFGGFRKFFVEPRIMKKKRKEMLFVEASKDENEEEIECQNYNDLKLKLAKKRKNAKFSFLQLGRPSGYANFFFMALTRKSTTTVFQSTFTYSVTVIHAKSGRIRFLDETEDTDLDVECSLNTETSTDDSGLLDCKDSSNSGVVPQKVDSEDPDLGGIPEDAAVDTNPSPDYSQKANLEIIDKLPVVTITGITSNNCASTGSYTIDATYEDSNKVINYTTQEQVTIPFSNPDSSGLCKVTVVDDSTLSIACENKEAFKVSEIIIGAQIVNDQNGNPLFKINQDYTHNSQFACAISDKSLETDNDNDTDEEMGNDSSSDNSTVSSDIASVRNAKYFRNGSSGGLSGGAIAGIVISVVAVAIIVGVLVALIKKGTIGAGAANVANSDISTVDRLKISNPNANII